MFNKTQHACRFFQAFVFYPLGKQTDNSVCHSATTLTGYSNLKRLGHSKPKKERLKNTHTDPANKLATCSQIGHALFGQSPVFDIKGVHEHCEITSVFEFGAQSHK